MRVFFLDHHLIFQKWLQNQPNNFLFTCLLQNEECYPHVHLHTVCRIEYGRDFGRMIQKNFVI